MLKQGHSLTLYCYDEVAGIPDGVRVEDASTILPRSRIFRHESGSIALFSDLFRYELQRQEKGVWVDSDVYFVRPLDTSPSYIFGRQCEHRLNSAVLKLPPCSALLEGLLRIFDEKEVPFWLRPEDFKAASNRLEANGRTNVSMMPWGSAGPNALTALADHYGVAGNAAPSSVFYPRHYKQAAWICDPSCALEDFSTEFTVAIHLWNEIIKRYKGGPIIHGSFLSRLHDEGA
ncbi:hypothetical protein OVA03_07565 [Asticcacaulis sp. SL142]|uniref:hypothetical protein n=1 Tax=Asticcacaulis sp. SL142 TaxID=2995155 RepID=UPI00226CBE60|nr:hypothetical protein [Asticcacaulis sp. SL142]WAC49746.1 hypothetical protein OVA03_07565 [Asticcacaulis sp. SL142]